MLRLDRKIVKQLALSLNHQKEGDEPVPYLSIAYTEVLLDEDQIDALMGKCTYRSWFNINGKDIQPMDWTRKVDLKCGDAFKDVEVEMLVNGKQELEFEECRLYIDRFKLLSGGQVMADLHLHVVKHKESDMIQIRRAEFSEVKLSLGEGVLIEKKARKQRELPLGADPESVNESTTTAEASPGDATETGKDTDGADNQEFEDGVAKALGAHKKRGMRVIDGRSERVKHQDRQRGRDDAH